MLSSLGIAFKRIALNNFRSYSMKKEARRFRKMVDKMSNKKKTPHFSPILLSKSSLSSAYDNEGSTRRLTSLNKTYMEELLVLMSGGEYKNQIADLGIQIVKVSMAKGLNFLNIYWISTNENLDENLANQILTKALEELQMQMGSLRFISKVPFLRFVRDKRLENERNLEKIFQTADFGNDFKPVYETKVFTPDFVPKTEKFPEMKQNVLGLDHAKIKGKIEDKILKFKAIKIDWIENENSQQEDEVVPEKLIVFNQKEFYKFYKRRRILELKMRKKLGSKHSVVYENEDFDEEDDYNYLEEEEEEEEKDDDDNHTV